MTVERTFGIYRKKLEILNNIQSMDPDVISRIIIASCILHNLLIRTKDIREWVPEDGEYEDEPGGADEQENAKDWRNEIVSQMFD